MRRFIFICFVLHIVVQHIHSIGPGLSHFNSRVHTGSSSSAESNWGQPPAPIPPTSVADPKLASPLSHYTNEANSYAYWNCHTIPPNMTLCKSVGYSQMVLPNFLQHESLREVIQQANVWVALVNTDCHKDIQRFLCSLYAPVCLKSHQEAKIPPCWELCDQVRTACLPRMRLFGFDWPEIVQCKQFPKLAESMCIPPQEHTVVKCAPCEQAITLENIASSYCMADVVLKATLKDILPQSNRASLRLIPNARTQALKLLRTDGTVATSFNFQRLRKRSRQRLSRNRMRRSRVYRHTIDPNNDREQLNDNQAQAWSRSDNTNQTVGPGWYEKSNKNKQSNRRNQPQRRRARNSQLQDLDGIQELELGCSACPTLTPFIGSSIGAAIPNSLSQRRWLIMGRRILDERTNQYSNRVQVTFFAAWDRSSPRFRRSLTAIRTQPVSHLCPKKPSVITDPVLTPSGPVLPVRNVKISRSATPALSDAPIRNRPNTKVQRNTMNNQPANTNNPSPVVSAIRREAVMDTVTPPTRNGRQRVQTTTALYHRWNKVNSQNNSPGVRGSLASDGIYKPRWSRTGVPPSEMWMDEKSRREKRRRRRRRRREWRRRRREHYQPPDLDTLQAPLRDKPINPYGTPDSESQRSPYWPS